MLSRGAWRGFGLALTCIALLPVVSSKLMAENASSLVINHNPGTDAQLSLFPGGINANFDPIPVAQSGPAGSDNQEMEYTANLVNRTGVMKLVLSNSTASLMSPTIACISCDPNDYSGLQDPGQFLNDTLNRFAANIAPVYGPSGPSVVLLYTRTADWCSVDAATQAQNWIFTMTSMNSSIALYNALVAGTYGNSTSWISERKISLTNSPPTTDSGFYNTSSTTTIAMIVLYSVTGIITFLFLVVIVMGALRAHRHPERYGPRNILGMPRQSRARGMARAMLETIPIIKFGENDSTKTPASAPTQDIELGNASAIASSSATPASQHMGESGQLDRSISDGQGGTEIAAAPMPTEAVNSSPLTSTPTKVHGAETIPVPSTGVADPPGPEDTVSCPICTEDFVKGEPARHLPCDHNFHPACIDPWLLNVSSTCPLCRVDLNPPPGITSSEEGAPAESANETPPISGRWSRISRLAFLDLSRASREERIDALRQVRQERAAHEPTASRTNRVSRIFHRNSRGSTLPMTTSEGNAIAAQRDRATADMTSNENTNTT